MFHIGYVSSAAVEFTKPQLRDLLERSRDKNQRLAITGLLLYRDGNFMQVMEGTEQTVRKLYETVRQDSRHKDIFTLFEECIPERDFPDWSMAFHDFAVEDCRQISGYSDFLSTAWIKEERSTQTTKARRLLAGFKERLR